MLKNKEWDIINLITGRNNPFTGDDCAVWNEKSLVVTTDHMCEGIHFDFDIMPPESAGWRLMAANASDIISMGSVPTHFLFNIAIPENGIRTAEKIISGVRDFASKHNILLMGGDTTAGKSFMIGATMLGSKPEKPLLRSGAKPGDTVYLASYTGLSKCGLIHLKNKTEGFETSKQKFMFPDPFDYIPTDLTGINCAIDISDSLKSELELISAASNVSLKIDFDSIPVHKEVAMTSETLSFPVEDLLLGSGEEFILLFTSGNIIEQAYPIGKVIDSREAKIEITSKNRIFDLSAVRTFSHFG